MEKNEFNLPPALFAVLQTATEAFYQAVGKALGAKPSEGPAMMSYPPAHDEETALDNARNGYGLEGIRGGRLLDDGFLKTKREGLPLILKSKELSSVPPAMVEFGWMTNMTEFQDTIGLGGGPFPYARENFAGKTLGTYILEYWAAKAAAGGGLPSGGAVKTPGA